MLTMMMVFMLAGKAEGQFTITCSDRTCYIDGTDDGAISIQITTGTPTLYRYSISGPVNISYPSTPDYTADLSHTFIDLPAGTYNIIVVDNQSSPHEEQCTNVVIAQPLALSWNTDEIDWTCYGADPCTGRRPSLSGGTPPYNYTVDPGGSPIPAGDQDKLCAGTYTISGTDANGCYLDYPEPFVVLSDNEAPINCQYPEDWYRTSEQFNTLISSTPPTPSTVPFIRAIDGVAMGYDYVNNTEPTADQNPSVRFGINADNYTNIEFRVTATPSGGVWSTNDYLRIYICYDTITPTWIAATILDDNCEWNTSDCDGTITPGNEQTAWMPLAADNQRKFWIRIDCSTDDITKSYNDISIEFRGYNIQEFLNSRTGMPWSCEDNTVDYHPTNDVHITWRCFDPPEFSYKRVWAPRDVCGHIVATPVTQYIRVGDKPTINGGTPLSDLTFDYCHNSDVNITAPTATDANDCDNEPTISWRIFDNQPNEIGSGTGNIIDFDFPNDFYPPTYTGINSEDRFTIEWIATDDAGISSNTVTQNVIFTQEIIVSIVPNVDDVDFCSEEEVTFTISATGGTGVFETGNISVVPAPASYWLWGVNSGTYTTDLLTNAAPNITVTIVDSNSPTVTGGCPPFGGIGNNITFPTAGDPEYTVHPNITTNPLIRVP
jgi:hypothetical protein